MAIDQKVALYTLLFVVPGFILSWIISLFVSNRTKDVSQLLIQYLSLTSLNYAVWSWLLVLLANKPTIWLWGHGSVIALSVFFIMFVSPVAIGLLIGNLIVRNRKGPLWRAIGFNPNILFPVGWDYKFNQLAQDNQAAFLKVILTDGGVVGGAFSGRSFASTDPAERDLVLEEAYRYDGERWHPVPNSAGMWVRGDRIAAVEFVFDSKEEPHVQETAHPDRKPPVLNQ
ncbi:MAG TPA: DUF6338 family protein [Pantanalinema sp.]